MAINSLYDERRRKKVLRDVEKGRYEPRESPRNAAAEVPGFGRRPDLALEVEPDPPAESFGIGAPDSQGKSKASAPAWVQGAAIAKPRAQNSFSKTEPLVEGPAAVPSSGRINSIREVLNGALFLAIRDNDLPLAEDIIKRGADVNAVEIDNDSSVTDSGGDFEGTVMFSWHNPLRLAMRLGHSEIEQLLRRNGAREEIRVEKGYKES